MNETLQALLKALHQIADSAEEAQGEWLGVNQLYAPENTRVFKHIAEVANQAIAFYALEESQRKNSEPT